MEANVGASESHPETVATDDAQRAFRDRLSELFSETPLPSDDLLANLLLYVRSGLVAKLLVMNELYERIRDVPGVLCEFGVWWGQNIVLLENLRAIHEPFNKQRVILGFDSFAGYGPLSDHDRDEPVFSDGTYATPEGYREYLAALLEVHEGMNALGHVRGNHRLIEGDVQTTLPTYLQEHPETIIAFSYFDLGLYEPTRAALEAIKPHLVPGSVILLDELTWPGAPGEAVAFKEAFADVDYGIEKAVHYPSKAIVTVG